LDFGEWALIAMIQTDCFFQDVNNKMSPVIRGTQQIRGYMANSARFISIGVLLLILGELIVRTLITSPASAVSDHELGWMWKPHSTIFHTKEGWAVNTLNSMGFNDNEISLGQSKQRILVLGDSYTEALQVPQSKNFTSIVENNAQCIDVFNGGRSGLSPIEYPVIAERLQDRLSPNMIVVVITPGDVSDINKNNAEIIRNPNNGNISNIILKEHKLHWLRKEADVILSKSALATYLKDRLKALNSNSKKAKKSAVQASSITEQQEIQNDKAIRDILTYTFNKINAKVPLYILYIPSLEYKPKGKTASKMKLDNFEKIVKEVAEKNQIPFLSARNFMVKSYQYNNRPPVGFPNNNILSGHLNEIGHQCVATALLELINIQCVSGTKQNNTGVDI